jgi:hypothetical protein
MERLTLHCVRKIQVQNLARSPTIVTEVFLVFLSCARNILR